MERNPKQIYCFIYDETGKYYQATCLPNGTWRIDNTGTSPYPIKYNPLNYKGSPLEFATNDRYFAPVRTLNEQLLFIKDGAAIMRHFYFLGKGFEQKLYIRIVQWDGSQIPGRWILGYAGRVDFSKKTDDPKPQEFLVPVIDDSTWALLSQRDKVPYTVQCNATNPKAIRVLVDGTTLVNKYTFQTVSSDIRAQGSLGVYQVIHLVLANQDGDSYGILAKNQTSQYFGGVIDDFLKNSPSFALETVRPISDVHVEGSIDFECTVGEFNAEGLNIYIRTNFGNQYNLYYNPFGYISAGSRYQSSFSFDINLAESEEMFFLITLDDLFVADGTIIHPIVTNITVSAKTKNEPVVVYAVRPLDVVQDVVSQATQGRGSIDSNYLRLNNKVVYTSGDAIRGIDNAVISIDFDHFFSDQDAQFFAALRNINGNLWIEPATTVYKQDSTIFNLGDAISCKFKTAEEFFGNSIIVGSPKQDYRHPSGRLEVNSENLFSLDIINSDKRLDFRTKSRTGCYDINFLILDYKGSSTKDNTGDNSPYLLAITDQVGYAVEDVETFVNSTFNNSPLAPIIKSPLTNDRITYNKPVIKGIAKPGDTVNIYADTVLDGTAIAGADGKWSYELVNALASYVPLGFDGVHVIQASFTDLSAPNDSITVTINTTTTTPVIMSYPVDGQGIYNNKPLIKGVGQRGTNVDIFIDGILVQSVVADSSCKWEWKSTVIANGNRVIVAGASTANIIVDSNTAFPLVTFVNSELDGFTIINNLPLIEGVGIPGTTVQLFLDYISYILLGSAVIDANGNWSFQVVAVSYIDPFSGTPVVVAPIANGLHVISTSLINHSVGVGVFGYLLDRPAYTSITGVTDNTVFNTTLSPKRLLLAQAPRLSAILNQQPNSEIEFQKADKNANQVTTIGGVTISERANVPRSSLGNPLYLPEYAEITTRVPLSFNQILYNFSNGGLIQFTFRGTELFALPIGTMKQASITNKVQEWKLLLSSLNSYITLLNVYKNGLRIIFNEHEMYHSDYNSLHMVTYDYQLPAKYKVAEYDQNWFNNRNAAWVVNPKYIQKFQKTDDPIKDQIITNGTQSPVLRMYSCKDAVAGHPEFGIVDTINYEPVVPNPLTGGDIVYEAEINLSDYPVGQYFFCIFVEETPVAISERIEVRLSWPKTIFIEAYSSINEPGFFFSTGIRSKFRVNGLVGKWMPDGQSVTSIDESGNTSTQYNLPVKKRKIRIGDATGEPDFMGIKVNAAVQLDNKTIEGVSYTIKEGTEITTSENVNGYPMNYYEFEVNPVDNKRGQTFQGVPGEPGFEGTVLILEPQAVGLPAGSLISIELNKE